MTYLASRCVNLLLCRVAGGCRVGGDLCSMGKVTALSLAVPATSLPAAAPTRGGGLGAPGSNVGACPSKGGCCTSSEALAKMRP
eukprot:CAMPEP_0172663046 /NCGR_PEP_ID=MMETSP1074-20121228/5686_1 /TAXON_ID=2916 /ORGANISM="Ceratium fusus, Strain PA161109" /LENGTH=83 /DNA_ID=CAMNT_0013478991 /DNA_START=618 /DNA_END=869 /DNA_ORIENTATION=+